MKGYEYNAEMEKYHEARRQAGAAADSTLRQLVVIREEKKAQVMEEYQCRVFNTTREQRDAALRRIQAEFLTAQKETLDAYHKTITEIKERENKLRAEYFAQKELERQERIKAKKK